MDVKNSSVEEIFTLAWNYEKKGILLYSQFKDLEIFSQILAIKNNGLEILNTLAKNKNYNPQIIDFDIFIPSNLDDKLIIAINYELELCEFYEKATEILNDEFKDIFFRLWATSQNEYIPTLKLALGLGRNEEKNDMMSFLNEAKKIANGEASIENLQKLVENPSFSFFGGLAAGGLAGLLLNEILKKENNE